MFHYMFLSDPRTERIVAEPKASNTSVMKLILNSGMHIETVSIQEGFCLIKANGKSLRTDLRLSLQTIGIDDSSASGVLRR